MKKTKKKANKKQTARRLPEGLMEFFAVLGVVILVVVLIFCIRSCSASVEADNGIFEDTIAPADDTPVSTVLDPVPAEGVTYPVQITSGITVDQIYTATGYFPEDGSDESVENVLAVKLTNTAETALEYLTFSLTVNGEEYDFAAATVPAGSYVYVFNTDRKSAPEQITSAAGTAEFEIYFAEEPSAHPETFAFDVQNGTIVVTNISDSDIPSDIMVYYKSTSNSGYLGGITYRLRVSGGLKAGESYNGYAPHAYAHMTEVMFVQYEE